MAAATPRPLSAEEIANTEKKLDMPLDDIIKMSQDNTTNKPKKNWQQQQQRRAPNKGAKVFNNPAKDRALKVRQYMDSRPFVRQGFLAKRRSHFQGNQFPLATEYARKAANAPFRSRPIDRSMMTHSSKARVAPSRGFMVHRRAGNGGPAAKPQQHQQQQQGDRVSRQRPQTLDARFANMKEQRMKALSRQNNAAQHSRNNGMPRVPWARGRFGN